MKLPIQLVPLMVIALVSISCGSHQETTSDVKIVGGTAVGDQEDSIARRSTVALTTMHYADKGRNFCSATLIGPQLLLTAAHCITNDEGKIATGAPLYGAFATEVSMDDAVLRRIDAVAIHKAFNLDIVYNGNPEAEPMRDVAVVRFQGALPQGYEPVALVDESANYTEAQNFLIAGYGVTSSRHVGDVGQLRKVEVHLEREATAGSILIVRGPRLSTDAITRDKNGEKVTVPANGGACAGDSGGPAYLQTESGWKLAGITSYGEELEIEGYTGYRFCVGENAFTDVRHYGASVRRAISGLLALPPVDTTPPDPWTAPKDKTLGLNFDENVVEEI